MALMGSRIENFNKLQFLGALGGYDFCVSSTSFQKSNLGWPQQPPTENTLYIYQLTIGFLIIPYTKRNLYW